MGRYTVMQPDHYWDSKHDVYMPKPEGLVAFAKRMIAQSKRTEQTAPAVPGTDRKMIHKSSEVEKQMTDARNRDLSIAANDHNRDRVKRRRALGMHIEHAAKNLVTAVVGPLPNPAGHKGPK